jgi:hypothetical protein
VVSKEPSTSGIERDGSEGWAKVTVVQGRLSVDLRDADITMVLSRIGEQAGFSVITDPIARKTVSVQFTDVELMQGLRRLLRLASLSYAVVNATRTASGVGLKELWVFAEGEGDPRRLPQVAARTVEAPTRETPQLQQAPPVSPNDVVELLQQLPEPPQGQQVPAPSSAPPNPFAELFQQLSQPPQGQQVPVPSPAPPNPFVELFQRLQ